MKVSPKVATRMLFACAATGSESGVLLALRLGAMINHVNKRGRSALIRVARAPEPNPRVVRVLLNAGADPNTADISGRTALDYARRALIERRSPPDDPSEVEQSLDRARRALDMPEEELMHDFELESLADAEKQMSPEEYLEFRAMYVATRREVASKSFYDTSGLERVIDLLERATAKPR